MKIIRFLTNGNEIRYGAINSQFDTKARLITGSIYEDFKITEETAEIKKHLVPVTPPNIIGIGLNYAKHADETGVRYPEMPVMFLKGTNTLIAAGDTILIPAIAEDEIDYEAELAVIIGKTAKNVPPHQALDYVLGYSCANDVTAREWQNVKQKKQWARGKSFDTFCPIGPWIVTKDEIPNPNNLHIQTDIDGFIFQDSNTSDMIFDVQTLISHLSQSLTLLPGTVILTGTPEGVGFTRKPPVFLHEGNSVSVSIEKIGKLTNPVAKEIN